MSCDRVSSAPCKMATNLPSQEVVTTSPPNSSGVNDGSNNHKINITDHTAWKTALSSPRPVLAHLNADTTWLLQLPYPACTTPPPGRTRYNVLLDPWLTGPQSDVASWFSTQWHVIPPNPVKSMTELNTILSDLENGHPDASYIDVVAISHEFTDHCHKSTLLELPKQTPVIAADKAAELIRSWSHFDTVITAPGFFASKKTDWREQICINSVLPNWLGIGRIITEGNSLYYHSAVLVVFETASESPEESVIYTPHGIDASTLSSFPFNTLALLHGLHDVKIRMTAQLNLGAHNGIKAAMACKARYWIATHDEVKKGGGFIALLLRRKVYTLQEAVEADKKASNVRGDDEDGIGGYQFFELGSGEGLVLR